MIDDPRHSMNGEMNLWLVLFEHNLKPGNQVFLGSKASKASSVVSDTKESGVVNGSVIAHSLKGRTNLRK